MVREAAAFFRPLKRLSAQSNQGLPSFLSTHPDPGENGRQVPPYGPLPGPPHDMPLGARVHETPSLEL